MNKQLLLNDISTLLDMHCNDISKDFNLKSSNYWDSLSQIALIGSINIHYSVNISGSELVNIVTIEDLFSLIELKSEDK